MDAKKNGQELAFPFVETREMQGESISFGLTKREEFAKVMMSSMIAAGYDSGDTRSVEGWRDQMAHEAVRYADALLRALSHSAGGEA